MADSFEQLRAEFLAETEDTLQNLQQDLNELVEARDPEALPAGTLERVFRTTHSLKGVAGMFGLARMSAVSHAMESVFESVRQGEVILDAELTDLLHRGNEALHALLNAGAAGDESTEERAAQAVIKDVEAALTARRRVPTAEDCPVTAAVQRLDPGERESVERAITVGHSVVVVAAELPQADFEEPFRQLLEAIRGWGTVHGSHSREPGEEEDRFEVRLVASGSEEVFQLMKAVGPLGGRVVLGETAGRSVGAPSRGATPSDSPSAEPEVAPEADAPAPPRTRARAGGSLRVPVDRVDRLLAQLGGLIQAKMGLDETAATALAGGSPTGPTVLRQSLRGLDRQIRSLRDGILGVRLVSLAPLFQKLERTVREASRVTGKDARLFTEGEHLELDKGIVETLTDALIHLVRNAVDHGVESAEGRAAAGKEPAGTVRVFARSEGAQVVIDVEDDGGGIDLGQVAEVARERGLVREGIEPSRQELLDLLFEPGFTLRRSATELSGRGVGLDAVRDAASRSGGTVEVVDSEVGTNFRLRVPVSLAVTRALEFEVASQAYFIPLSHVQRVLRLDASTLETDPGGDRVFREGGRAVPVRTLAQLLPVAGPIETDTGPALMLRLSDRRLVLPVDQVGHRREVVVRSLGELLPSVPGVSGCAELGDGRTVLILDPLTLFRASHRGLVEVTP